MKKKWRIGVFLLALSMGISILPVGAEVQSLTINNYEAISNMELNHSCVFLKVGESVKLSISRLHLIEPDGIPSGDPHKEIWITSQPGIASLTLSGGDPIDINHGIATPLNQTATVTATAPGEADIQVTRTGFGVSATAACHIIAYQNSNDSEIELNYSRLILKTGECVNLSISQLQLTEFSDAPAGNPHKEIWLTSQPKIASLTLSGGDPIDINHGMATPLNQIATVTATAPGDTEILVTRSGFGASATAICRVTVYQPGDIDSDGKASVLDALMALQTTANKISLDEVQQAAADVDEKEGVTAFDALLILKAATGKLSLR